MPELVATASASSTTSSRDSTRSPSVSTPTLHLTGTLPLAGTFLPWPKRGNGGPGSPQRTQTGCSRRLAQLRQQRRELFQAAQVVAGQHQVGVLGGNHHPERARPEVRVVALVRVHPYQAVAQPGKAFHRRRQDRRAA